MSKNLLTPTNQLMLIGAMEVRSFQTLYLQFCGLWPISPLNVSVGQKIL